MFTVTFFWPLWPCTVALGAFYFRGPISLSSDTSFRKKGKERNRGENPGSFFSLSQECYERIHKLSGERNDIFRKGCFKGTRRAPFYAPGLFFSSLPQGTEKGSIKRGSKNSRRRRREMYASFKDRRRLRRGKTRERESRAKGAFETRAASL